MTKNKHLSLEDRTQIKIKLDAACSFRKIAKDLGKSPTTISNEVKTRRLVVKKGGFNRPYNPCSYRFNCKLSGYCKDRHCSKVTCFGCKKVCSETCAYFREEFCVLLEKPPYVCNACEKKARCTLTKYEYRPVLAQHSYEETLSDARKGSSFSPEELLQIDTIVSNGVKRGLSPYAICAEHRNELLCSERSIYRFIEAGMTDCKNLDLPYKIRYRPRRKRAPFKIDKGCRKGRTYKDFMLFLEQNQDTSVVEMDTLMGKRGGKSLLSFYFRQVGFLLLLLRPVNNAQSVIDWFDQLDHRLGRDNFKKLFPVILTDNGSEFSNPAALEFDQSGEQRTRIFYCDPGMPNQKPGVENAQKHVRRILPKGTSFESLTQDEVNCITGHLNSYKKKKLNDRTPISVFNFFYGSDILETLEIPEIESENICLNKLLLK